jgi:hypothetical protein
MSAKVVELSDAGAIAPSLASADLNRILQSADALLALMGREPLNVVAELADELSRSAHSVGAAEIEAAAIEIRRLACARGSVALAGAMHALTAAIARTERLIAA